MKGRGKRLFKDLLDTDTIVLLALEPLVIGAIVGNHSHDGLFSCAHPPAQVHKNDKENQHDGKGSAIPFPVNKFMHPGPSLPTMVAARFHGKGELIGPSERGNEKEESGSAADSFAR